MSVTAAERPQVETLGWEVPGWRRRGVLALTATRHADAAGVARTWGARGLVDLEQVHGASWAAVEAAARPWTLRGCDAVATDTADAVLVVRTADCLPIFLVDPVRRLVALAHVGWRGLAVRLPLRLVAGLGHWRGSRPRDLRAAFGPGIRACCYEVGPEFQARFGPWVREASGRRTCDLAAAASAQLVQGGLSPAQILDSQECTACRVERWYSTRREGPQTGRLHSLIMLTR